MRAFCKDYPTSGAFGLLGDFARGKSRASKLLQVQPWESILFIGDPRAPPYRCALVWAPETGLCRDYIGGYYRGSHGGF